MTAILQTGKGEKMKIETRFCGPTNTRGSRVKVTGAWGSKYYEWRHDKNVYDNHKAALMDYVQNRVPFEKVTVYITETDRGLVAYGRVEIVEVR